MALDGDGVKQDDNHQNHLTTFTSLCTSIGIDTRLRKALSRLNLIHPTLVQSKAIPLAISSGRDLLVRARTGSGKTLAYCIPVLQRILVRKILVAERGDADEDDEEQQQGGGTSSSSVGGVILVPTRELCDQVSRVLDDLSYYCADVVKVVTLSSSTPSGGGRNGGSSAASNNKARKEMLRQEALLRDRPDVIVATPAGLVTHVRSGALNLKRTVETLVVDEADLILSFGKFVYIRGEAFMLPFFHNDYQAISSVGGIQPKFMTRQFACII